MKPKQNRLCFALLIVLLCSAILPINLLANIEENQAEMPSISVKRGFYDSPFDVTISSTLPGMKIYYTLDGTDPRNSSTAKTASSPVVVRIDPNSKQMRGLTPGVVLRAAATKESYLFSKVATSTYLFPNEINKQLEHPGHDWPTDRVINNQEIDLLMDTKVVYHEDYYDQIQSALLDIPTFSIVTDNANLFDKRKGIYVNALGNRGEEWERPASIELIYPDGTKGFQIDAGIRIRGGYSRNGWFAKHGFRVFFSSKYGESNLNYPLFGEEGTDKFDKIDLRCSQNYSWSKGQNEAPYCTFNRDVFSRDLQREMGQPYTRSRYYHLFVNGMYWGLFQTQERSESSFAASYFGGNDEDYDVIKHSGSDDGIEVNDGSIDAWKAIWEMCEEGFVDNDNYYKIQGLDANGKRDINLQVLVDMDNFIDYMNVIFYTGNFDAPYSSFLNGPNNFYAIYNRNGEEGFKFFAHDNEHTLIVDPINVSVGLKEDRVNFGDEKGSKKIMTVSSIETFQPQWLHVKLAKNSEYRSRFADRAYELYYNSGLLTPEKTAQLFKMRTTEYDTALIAESARWGDVDGILYTKNDNWVPMIQYTLNEFFPKRSDIVMGQLKFAGLLPFLEAPEFRMNNALLEDKSVDIFAGNIITLRNGNGSGSIKYTLDGTDPRLSGGSLLSNAIDGENLINISVLQNTVIKARIYDNGDWSALHTIQIKVNKAAEGLQITEIHYNPLGMEDLSGSEFEFIELRNNSNETISLASTLFNGIQYMFNDTSTIAAGGFLVLASNAETFKLRYGFEPYGEYDGQLSNGGERITLLSVVGDTIVSVKYNDKSPWPTVSDGLGFSIVPVQGVDDADWDEGKNWRPSYQVHGSPGAPDVELDFDKVFINEVLANTSYPLVDAIEIYNPNETAIDISYWYLSDDKSKPQKWQIPDGTVIAAGGYTVFYAGHFVGETLESADDEFGSAFSLSSRGDDIYLFSGNSDKQLTSYDHHYDFPDSDPGVSFGRYEISTGKVHFVAMDQLTLGKVNSLPKVGPVVINQLMYHPLEGDFEYMELVNISDSTVKMYEATSLLPWKVSGIDFDFPHNFSLQSGTSVYLVEAAISPEDFRFIHNLSEEVFVFNFDGKMNNGGEEITLYKSAPQYLDNEVLKSPYIRVDRVEYNDNSKWPDADGNGLVLIRKDANAYGNDPGNWEAGIPEINISKYPVTTGISGILYRFQLKAGGGTVPYNWTLQSGNLPSGLELSTVGIIEGVPTETGEFEFSVQVADSLGNTDEAVFSISIAENSDPVAITDLDTTTMNIGVVIDVLANDVDEDGDKGNWILSIISDPTNGTVIINNDRTITYYPTTGFMGTDTLRYKVEDVNGASEANVIIDVQDEFLVAEVETPINQTSDDACERLSTGVVYLDNPWLDLGYNVDNGGSQLNGLRFQNVSIPKNAKITKAYIQFVAYYRLDYDSEYLIFIEDDSNPSTYSDVTKNISTRNYYFDDIVEWTPPIWMTVDQAGEDERTPDLSALVQYMVNKDDWQSDNAMAFMFSPVSQLAIRLAYSFDVDPDKVPVLHVEFETEGSDYSQPLANAGKDKIASIMSTVMLDGSKSKSPDGRLLNYHWTMIDMPEGSMSSLDNNTVVKPQFNPDVFGEYTFTLQVDNGYSQSEVDTVVIEIVDQKPMAFAGLDQVKMLGTEVRLNGRYSSDIDNQKLSYKWSILDSPAGSNPVIKDESHMNPFLIADKAGDYSITLVVNDGTNNSDADTVLVQLIENQLPVALISDQYIAFTGIKVCLDGSESYDPENFELKYNWTLESKPGESSAVLSDSATVKPTFFADMDGDYTVSLRVYDGFQWSTTVKEVLSVGQNTPPLANAGEDQEIYQDSLVYLDGSKSTDPDGTQLSYLWTFVTKPTGAYTPILDPTAENAYFEPDVKGVYTIRLMVSDGVVTSTDDVQINVTSLTDVLSFNLNKEIKVYPNPFVDKINVDIPGEQNGSVRFELYNVSGMLLESIECDNCKSNAFELDFQHAQLQNGVYLLMVRPENQAQKMFRLMYQGD